MVPPPQSTGLTERAKRIRHAPLLGECQRQRVTRLGLTRSSSMRRWAISPLHMRTRPKMIMPSSRLLCERVACLSRPMSNGTSPLFHNLMAIGFLAPCPANQEKAGLGGNQDSLSRGITSLVTVERGHEALRQFWASRANWPRRNGQAAGNTGSRTARQLTGQGTSLPFLYG